MREELYKNLIEGTIFSNPPLPINYIYRKNLGSIKEVIEMTHKKRCDLCGKVIEHDKDLEICEECLSHGMQVLKKVLEKMEKSKE